ncbi:hypothetical protein N7507_003016 [Penicillium longicatenatum]|nr:hypothetical protein N7507_003016 [Penicillium longicatenatum]
MWVVGFTTVANTVSLGNTAKTYAMMSIASSLGSSTGPMLSGILYQLEGYWVAWISAFVLLGVDMAFRLLMVEKKRLITDTTDDLTTERDSVSERSPLLSTHNSASESHDASKGPNFYWCIFSKVNFVAGVYLSIVFGLLIGTFNATIPLHVRDVFGWGGMQSGIMFACLQAPRLLMSPFVGWLKDRYGTRIPTAFGFATLALLVWLLGVPGSAQCPFSVGDRGPTIYVWAMILLGFQTTYMNGSGMIEATEVAVSELQKKYPGAFGPNGGKSRAVAIVGVAWTLGTCICPLMGGILNEKFGYYVMNCVVVLLHFFAFLRD